MRTGPARGTRAAGPSMAEKAALAFAAAGVPDWVAELAALADREGLKGAAARIGYSPSAVSTVINGRYAGDIARVEECVRGALMNKTVDCPVLGPIPRNECLAWQKKPFAASSSIRVQVFRACRTGCLHSGIRGEA